MEERAQAGGIVLSVPIRDPDEPYSEVPTQAEREAAWPRFEALRGSCTNTDVLARFDAERALERRAAREDELLAEIQRQGADVDAVAWFDAQRALERKATDEDEILAEIQRQAADRASDQTL